MDESKKTLCKIDAPGRGDRAHGHTSGGAAGIAPMRMRLEHVGEDLHTRVHLYLPQRYAVLATARYDPTGFVAGMTHHTIINEVQWAPGILRVIKLVVGQKHQPGHFLLTGAANLLWLPTAKRLSA
jgi:hypothetical protein